jgi:hypothetical protein
MSSNKNPESKGLFGWLLIIVLLFFCVTLTLCIKILRMMAAGFLASLTNILLFLMTLIFVLTLIFIIKESKKAIPLTYLSLTALLIAALMDISAYTYSFMALLIWIIKFPLPLTIIGIYFYKSKRVKNTFVN